MTRLEKLKNLEKNLEDLMAKANSRTFAQLARQYRETIKEIEDIEGTEAKDDEIEEILQRKQSDGTARTVRPHRS